jgi:hypothetical protein
MEAEGAGRFPTLEFWFTVGSIREFWQRSMSKGAVNNSRKQRGRPFRSGVSGNARGRPKGSRNKRTRTIIEAAANGGELPLDYMLRIMRDPNASNTRRDEMARAAAPYLHPKMVATTCAPAVPA